MPPKNTTQKSRNWTAAERQYILDNAGRMRDEDIAASLSRLTGSIVTLDSVRHVRRRGGIKKRAGRGICEVASRTASPATLGISLRGDDAASQ